MAFRPAPRPNSMTARGKLGTNQRPALRQVTETPRGILGVYPAGPPARGFSRLMPDFTNAVPANLSSQPVNPSDPVADFAELPRRIREEGLLERQPVYYTIKIVSTLAMLALSIALLLVVDNFWFQAGQRRFPGFCLRTDRLHRPRCRAPCRLPVDPGEPADRLRRLLPAEHEPVVVAYPAQPAPPHSE